MWPEALRQFSIHREEEARPTQPDQSPDRPACQSGLLPEASSAVPFPLAMLYCTHGYLRRYGFLSTVSKIARYLWARIAGKLTGSAARLPGAPRAAGSPTLGLKAGDLVEVLSESEIRDTLDAGGALAGLPFLSAMSAYCGRKFVVLKRVERIYLEESRRTRRLRNTVLLDGVVCDGLHKGCDRCCFFYWREAWLRRAR